jgi:hypothetical protein
MSLEWLPELIEPEDGESIHGEYLDRVFAIYERDFVLSKPFGFSTRFATKRDPSQNGWPATFWHLISEGENEHLREVQIERCRYISWIRRMVDEFFTNYPERNSLNINWWRNQRRGASRILIATKDFSFLVVLEERRDYVLLWTAYPTRPHTSKKLTREHQNFWA